MKTNKQMIALLLGLLLISQGIWAQNRVARDERDDDGGYDQQYEGDDDDSFQYYGDENAKYYDRTQIDRFLDVQVWSNHRDGEYHEGERISFSFMANRDAFVAIYSIDTRGRANLLFPASPGQENYIAGGVTYRLPDAKDDYDLVVTGPGGTERIQIIASRERFPIPDWYPNSGILINDEDPDDYMDYVNARYFTKYPGQRFAYDRLTLYVNEWEPYYFQPVHYPVYPSWSVCGNVYIDYPFGASIYVNGIYWGCAPLYVPRILCGWHTITVYDRWGHCWEDDIHISRYNTVVLNNTIIRTGPQTHSKFKEVRFAGYREPSKSGYPDYATKVKQISSAPGVGKIAVTDGVRSKTTVTVDTKTRIDLPKKFAHGSAELVRTDRGYETSGRITKSRQADGRSSFSSRTKRAPVTVDNSGNNADQDNTYRPKSKAAGNNDNSEDDGWQSGGGTQTYRKGSDGAAPQKRTVQSGSTSTNRSGDSDKSKVTVSPRPKPSDNSSSGSSSKVKSGQTQSSGSTGKGTTTKTKKGDD